MKQLQIGDKVKIKHDLSINQPTKYFFITEAMEKMRGMVATITDVTNYADDEISYKINIGSSAYSWTNEMFENNVIKPKTQIMMFILGAKQLTVFDNTELQTIAHLLAQFRSAWVRDCALELSENIFTQFPITLECKSGSLIEVRKEDIERDCIMLEDFTKLSFIESLEIEKELEMFSKASVKLPTFVDFTDNTEIMVRCQYEPQIATVSGDDIYDEVVGFAIAYTKASLNLNYNGIKQLLKYWK